MTRMTQISTERVTATALSDANRGRVRWAPARSLWTGFMMLFGVGGALMTPALDNLAVFLASTAVTIGLGHSIGMHRLLIHRSFKCPRWLEYILVWLGVLVGMAGPLGMVRIHDLRDWAQRQTECHDFYAHRRGFWTDAVWQMHSGFRLDRPPQFDLEPRLAEDPVYRWMEKTWMLQQVPVALLLWWLGGVEWVIWGVALRVSVSLTGHWMVGHYAHRGGHQGWRVRDAAVQGFNLPIAALLSFGESWHANHHAYPGSAKLGLEPGQVDLGWMTLRVLERAGLVWDLKTPSDLADRPELHRLPAAEREGGACPLLELMCPHG